MRPLGSRKISFGACRCAAGGVTRKIAACVTLAVALGAIGCDGSNTAAPGTTTADGSSARPQGDVLPAAAPLTSATPEGGTAPSVGASAAASAATTASPSELGRTLPWDDKQKAGPPPAGWGERTQWDGTFEAQNALLFEELAYFHGLDETALARIKEIFAVGKHLGQGNPKAARHPASPAACEQTLKDAEVDHDDREAAAACGARYMARLYDPEKGETASVAKICIDKFEFPNIPCRYPVTWVQANEAAEICHAVGKRLCDAHEWEGACEGRLTPADYEWERYAKMPEEDARKARRGRHNLEAGKQPRLAYGEKYEAGRCATGSRKSRDCGVGWKNCGTNTYPAGMFPRCSNALGAFDLHGNAAEHMNLPERPDELASLPLAQRKYGHTEMKGSWFIFDDFHAHEDHCRWRAPYWHGTRVMSKGSHGNYHLGFRCCKDVE